MPPDPVIPLPPAVDPSGWFPPQPPEPPKSTLAIVGGAIKSAFLYCYNWEKANPRKTAAILLYISTHSTHLKPVLDMLSIITGMPLS